MAYCNLDDIKKMLPEANLVQLTDDEQSGVINEDRIGEAIEQAEGEIDSYLQGRYAVPISPVPSLINKLAVDIAIYNLYSRIPEEIPSTRAERYKNAVRILEGIAKGLISIGAEEPAASDQDQARIEAKDRIFTREKLKGF